MENKIRNLCVFLLLVTILNVAHSATKILVSHYKNWSHPVLNVFNKYDLSLYKIRFSEDGICPTFYLNFKHSPVPYTQYIVDYQNVYSEILKANFGFPYALVDKEDNLKINVGWNDENKKVMDVNLARAASRSLCKGAHPVDSGFEKVTINSKLEK
ncbi:MAG: hypothetical protein QM652_07295 [Legionella sp.]|uniref:hypothetical protein n=1 Tax=Legionella sp. TaxID=459 RepID=UPI0039E5FBA1